jgi:uncharacterized repeat protein (TIGR02543 family)
LRFIAKKYISLKLNGGKMKKFIVGFLSFVLLSTCAIFGVSAEENGVEELPVITSDNLVQDFQNGTLVDSYQVDGTTYLPYPSDWGMKVGKVGDIFTFVDNSGAAKSISGAHVASAMLLNTSLTSETKKYTVSCEVTGKERADWGGFGIMFGWINNSPLGLIYLESNGLMITMEGNEFAMAVEIPTESTITDFSLDVKYLFEITVDNGIVSISINEELINTADLSDKVITPAVGTEMKNYRAEYSNFSLTTDFEIDGPEVYEELENYSADTIGLLDTYNVAGSDNQPYPSDWGMKTAKVEGDYYTRVNNNLEPFINDAHTVSYLSISKEVSNVTNYYVSATVKPTYKNNWGGIGICIGRNKTDNSPITVWACLDNNTVYIAHSFNEFAVEAGVSSFAIDTSFNIGVVVNNEIVVIYINGERIGFTDLSALDIDPAIGTDMKNYNGEISNISFKTTETGLQNAIYTVSCISGSVEIGSIEYTYGEGCILQAVNKMGYSFGGWHLLPALSDEVVTELSATTGGDTKIYCEYSLENYDITYYDGNTVIEDESLENLYDFKSYIELKPFEKEGYTFDGWFESADFSGESVEAIQMGTTGDKIFYAKYTVIATEKTGCKSSLNNECLFGAIILLAAIIILTAKRKSKKSF